MIIDHKNLGVFLMKLKTFKRSCEKKSDVNKARREGKIPAVLYRRGKPSDPILVEAEDYEAVLRSVKPGRLSTTVITLVDEEGKVKKVLVKDIQYHVTSYKVIHLDFEELLDDVQIKVNVPLECTGVVDCVGVKLGGVLRQVLRHLKVQCLPKDMPEVFQMDVKHLGLKDTFKLKEINIPSTVRPLLNLNEVAAVIAKR